MGHGYHPTPPDEDNHSTVAAHRPDMLSISISSPAFWQSRSAHAQIAAPRTAAALIAAAEARLLIVAMRAIDMTAVVGSGGADTKAMTVSKSVGTYGLRSPPNWNAMAMSPGRATAIPPSLSDQCRGRVEATPRAAAKRNLLGKIDPWGDQNRDVNPEAMPMPDRAPVGL
jgi:hypothetical protein